MKRQGECVGCGACCSGVRITTILSHLISQHGSFAEAQRYYEYHGLRLVDPDQETDTATVEADLKCQQLTDDNRCLVHDDPEKKPVLCHRYPMVPDDIEGCGYSFR